MPRKNQRQDARRDANEPEIFNALEAAGHSVHRIGEPGDLVVYNRETENWSVLEVKIPGGRLSPKQIKFRKENPDVPIPVVESALEALLALR